MRAFIGIDLPPNIKEKIRSIQELLHQDIDCKWINPDNSHITLKFLGDINEDRAEKIKIIIEETAKKHAAFNGSLSSLGFFPDDKKPRVFFIAVGRSENLKLISQCLEEKLEKIGFKKEDNFKPHITLARLKTAQKLKNLKKKTADLVLGQELPIKELVLYKSALTQNGPVYEKIFTSSLTD